VTITKTCRECGIEKYIECDPAAVMSWQAGVHIQDAMPEVSADDRELLISGICGQCFDKLFEEDEEIDAEDAENEEDYIA
jgi:hypothetical protein